MKTPQQILKALLTGRCACHGDLVPIYCNESVERALDDALREEWKAASWAASRVFCELLGNADALVETATELAERTVKARVDVQLDEYWSDGLKRMDKTFAAREAVRKALAKP